MQNVKNEKTGYTLTELEEKLCNAWEKAEPPKFCKILSWQHVTATRDHHAYAVLVDMGTRDLRRGILGVRSDAPTEMNGLMTPRMDLNLVSDGIGCALDENRIGNLVLPLDLQKAIVLRGVQHAAHALLDHGACFEGNALAKATDTLLSADIVLADDLESVIPQIWKLTRIVFRKRTTSGMITDAEKRCLEAWLRAFVELFKN